MHVRKRAAALVGASLLVLAASFSTTVFAVGEKVILCHATSDEKHPYELIETDVASDGYVQGGHADHGRDGVWYPGAKDDKFDWGDIIPAYDTTVDNQPFHYDGLNLTAEGLAILDHDCMFEGEESRPPSNPPSNPPSFGQSFGGETDAPSEPSTDSLGTNGTSGPADGAWLLVVALGVLLASIVVLTPARAKSRR